jgi:opacity protein-like surface antigen
MKKNLLVLLALALAAAAAPARAQAVFPPPPEAPALTGPYVGAGFGFTQAKPGCVGFIRFTASCDDTDFTWALLAGYQLNRYFGAEAEYRDLGYVTGRDFNVSRTVHASAWDAAVIGFLPFSNRFSAFGKFGAYRALLEATGAPIADQHHTGATYGAGLQWDFARQASGRLQWQRYRQVNGGDRDFGSNDYDTLSAVLIWRLR